MMDFLKRISLYFIILLFIMSIYKDLTAGTNAQIPPPVTQEDQVEDTEYSIKQIKIKSGDTVLSVIEQIHGGMEGLSIDQILTDFQTINPNADPYHLHPNTFYYFPLYHEKEAG